MFPYVLNHRNGWIIPLALSLSSPSSVDAEESPPVNYGMIIFPAFQAIDVFGPLDILTILSWTQTLNLSVISTSLDPVNTKPLSMNISSNFGESIVPTHTFDQPPEDLEVLFVPGGLGTRSDEVVAPAVEFVKSVYPKLKYLVSVCTGATILAKAGVLDGKNATTNKHSWDWATSTGPYTCWNAHARWVTDGNIWTGSGITAGMDTTYAFISAIYGEDVAETIAVSSEYTRITDPSDDIFGIYWNDTSKGC